MSDQGVGHNAGGRAGHARHERLGKAKTFLVDEFRRYMVSFLYIWVLLGTFTMHQELAVRTHGGIAFAPHGFALINALVLGKVALVVEDLRLGVRIKAAPLIYPIVIEAALLAVLFILMHVLESVISGLLHGEALARSVPAIGGGGLLGLSYATASFFVAMLPFCAFRMIMKAVGPEQIRRLLFGPAAATPGEVD